MNAALRYASQIAYSSEETLQFTYDMAVKYDGGTFVECGVAAGAQVIAMASGSPTATIYALDSFCGIPLPSNRDDQMPGIAMLSKWEQQSLPDPGKQELITSGATSVPLEDFLAHLEIAGVLSEMIIPFKGWFENTIPVLAKELNEIHILRLDGDLYNSTWVCLQYLFPKVISGGCVIIDDIELPGCKAAVDEYFALIGYQPDYKYVSNICYFFK